MNELIFIVQSLLVAAGSIVALRLGKEALVAFMSLLCVLANVFVLKQIQLFGLQVTAADAFSVGAILSLHLLQEFFGKKVAKKAIWTSFFCLILYIGASQVHLWYTPSIWDTTHVHFFEILRFAPRVALASLLVYLFSMQLDQFLYERLQAWCGGKYLLLRNFGLLAFIQLIDTTLFTFFGLYGIVHSVSQVIVVSYAVKIVAIVGTTPALLFLKKLKALKTR